MTEMTSDEPHLLVAGSPRIIVNRYSMYISTNPSVFLCIIDSRPSGGEEAIFSHRSGQQARTPSRIPPKRAAQQVDNLRGRVDASDRVPVPDLHHQPITASQPTTAVEIVAVVPRCRTHAEDRLSCFHISDNDERWSRSPESISLAKIAFLPCGVAPIGRNVQPAMIPRKLFTIPSISATFPPVDLLRIVFRECQYLVSIHDALNGRCFTQDCILSRLDIEKVDRIPVCDHCYFLSIRREKSISPYIWITAPISTVDRKARNFPKFLINDYMISFRATVRTSQQ